MKQILLSFFLLSSIQSFAQNVKIVDIINDGEEFLILASDGLVYELTNRDPENLEFAYSALESHETVDLIKPIMSLNKFFDTRQKITGFQKFISESEQSKKNSTSINTENPTALDNYEVSTVSTEEKGLALFKTMRRDTRKRSQCYNRAHVWSFEMSKKLIGNKKINLGKSWIFFSRKYIKEYKYKWWFHIAPYIKYDNIDDIFVMDRKFTKKPLTLRDWTDTFMLNDAECSEVKYYSDYRARMYTEECFVIKSSMYYWQPNQIKALESGGEEKKIFKKRELETAYKNAVKRWRGEVEL
jgi:hypothetical protein